MRTSNPTLRADTFTSEALTSVAQPMTLGGTVRKTALLVALACFTATFTWKSASAYGLGLTGLGAIGGFIVAIVLAFKKTWAPVLAPVYALLEGLFLGGISGFYEARFGGIVGQAVMLTFGTLFALLAAYSTGLIKPSQNFRLGVFAATGAIAFVYLVSIVLGFFGIHLGFIHDSGWFGIGFSVFVVIIAALNLVLDFDFIEDGVAAGAPKYLEWYAAFGLMVTLVWLYLEILRLLAKLRSSND